MGLPEKGKKRKAEAELAKLRAEFEDPEEVGDLSSDMLFADYLLEWLEIAKGRLASQRTSEVRPNPNHKNDRKTMAHRLLLLLRLCHLSNVR